MTEKIICKTCRGPKANYHCGLCQDAVCKSCAEFLADGSFSFLRSVAKELTHSVYCSHCFDANVRMPLEDYEATLERAKDIVVFTKDQTKETRLMKKTEKPYQVEDCADEQEAIMKMSFFAIQDKFNALIEVKFTSKKIIVGSHKKLVWNATAIPTVVDPTRLRGDW